MAVSMEDGQAVSKGVAGEASYRIGALLYFRDEQGRLLLIKRTKQPNRGLWCAVGGKLEMATGESPYECAVREAREEVGVVIEAKDLSLRCMLAEREYEGTGHWLMFVFLVTRCLERLPEQIDEGCFDFFGEDELDGIEMPPMDRAILQERVLGDAGGGLHVLKASPGADRDPSLLVEEARIG